LSELSQNEPMATDRAADQVRFAATLDQADGKNATGIVIPAAVIEQLGAGRKPPLRVTLNGYEYRTTAGVMNGVSMIPVSAAVRGEAGLAAGDHVDVGLVVDSTQRIVDIPEDLAAAFLANPAATSFFETLSNSLQRYHVDNINAAKAPETRQRRIDKAIGLFLDGKPR
jgi:Bacteriocin-protection, YdeI or OmpD-Associated/Domain of unknown function (DUF1905)